MTTTKLPATYQAPADVLATRKALTARSAANLTTDDLLGMIGTVADAGRAANDRLAATIKASVRDTTARYEAIGLAMATLFARVGTDGTAPASDKVASFADLEKMFGHLGVDYTERFSMSPATMRQCRDAYVGQATATFAKWSDVRASNQSAVSAAPSFFTNDAAAVIRYSLARTTGRVDETTGHVLERGNRANGAESERRTLAEVKVSRDEDAKRALNDAIKVLTTKRSNTKLLTDGPADLTVGVINQLGADQIKALSLFLTARAEIIKASAPKHDAGSAGAQVKASRKVKASAK